MWEGVLWDGAHSGEQFPRYILTGQLETGTKEGKRFPPLFWGAQTGVVSEAVVSRGLLSNGSSPSSWLRRALHGY